MRRLALLVGSAAAVVLSMASGVLAGEAYRAEFTVGSATAEVGGKQVDLEVPVHVLDGVVWGSLRAVAEAMGSSVEWDPATRVASASLGGRTLRVTIGSPTAFLDGESIQMKRPAHVISGRTQVPLDLLARFLGLQGEAAVEQKKFFFEDVASPSSQPGEIGSTGGSTQGEITVDIAGFAFSPARITVTTGTTVTWVNEDNVPHTVSSDAHLFDSGRLEHGTRWSFTFKEPGTYIYRCNFHPSMTGFVTVLAS